MSALTTSTKLDQYISGALIGVASVIGGAVLGSWPTMLSSVSHSGAVWASLIGAAAFLCLVISIFFGGRGLAYGPGSEGWNDRFNLQAVFGAVGVVFLLALGTVIFVTLEPSLSEKYNARLTAVETHVTDLTSKIDGASRDLIDVKTRLDAMDGTLKDVGRSSVADLTKLNELDATIKSLAEAIQRLEGASNSPPAPSPPALPKQ
jgi:hypothetical protein